MNIVSKKYIFFALSFIILIPGIISLLLFGLRLSIDFTGGTRIALSLTHVVSLGDQNKIEKIFSTNNSHIATLQISGKQLIVRTAPMDAKVHTRIIQEVQQAFPSTKEDEYATIGPTIGQETTWNAIKGIFFASILIVLYISWSFRKLPKPASSWKFGICAIAALLHDVIAVVGLFSLFGHFFNVEIDSLFVTALLTIIGFSVHDTIVVFDRIRENLRKTINVSFPGIVNDSLHQTMTRSLNTSLTVILVLFTLLLFGGESIRWFIVALLAGIISGTYSSIFNASLLLVVWEEWDQKTKKK